MDVAYEVAPNRTWNPVEITLELSLHLSVSQPVPSGPER
jgi:hypothetical protein